MTGNTILFYLRSFSCSCKPLCVCVKGGMNKRRFDGLIGIFFLYFPSYFYFHLSLFFFPPLFCFPTHFICPRFSSNFPRSCDPVFADLEYILLHFIRPFCISSHLISSVFVSTATFLFASSSFPLTSFVYVHFLLLSPPLPLPSSSSLPDSAFCSRSLPLYR